MSNQSTALTSSVESSPFNEALKTVSTHLWAALIFSAFVNIAYLAPTIYMLAVYDLAVPASSELSLTFVTIALGLTLLALTYFDRIRSKILVSASLKLDNKFSIRVFKRAMSNPAVGHGVSQSLRDFDIIRGALTGPAALAFFDAPWIPIYIGVCFYLHPALGAFATAGASLLFGLAIWNERATRRLSDRALYAAASSAGAQESAGASADVIRALGMTSAFVSLFQAGRQAANYPQVEAANLSGRIGSIIRVVRLMLQSGALGLGAWLAIHNQISPGAIFASSMLAARALSPIDQIVAQWRTVSQARSAYDVLKGHLKADKTPLRTELPTPEAEITIKQVGVVSPARDRMLVREVALSAKGGQILGVVGASGAGKTTLLQVLAGARSADQGEVLLGGARYADYSEQDLGRFVGYLPQDCILFPGTVKDNISRFDAALRVDSQVVDSLAILAAKAAGVHDMVLALPQGYDTILGPRGIGLSAGQRQRIALARALYGDPLVYIFDEPNASLDAEGEAALLRVIAELKAQGSLVIVSAHSMSILSSADLLLVLKGGRQELFGPRDQVLEAMRGGDSARPANTPPRTHSTHYGQSAVTRVVGAGQR